MHFWISKYNLKTSIFQNSEDITLHNLSAIFHELQTGSTYTINAEGKEESKITELDELPEEEEEVRRDSDSAMEQSKPEGNREFYGKVSMTMKNLFQ